MGFGAVMERGWVQPPFLAAPGLSLAVRRALPQALALFETDVVTRDEDADTRAVRLSLKPMSIGGLP